MKTNNPILSARTYEILKWTAAVALPALAALYFALGEIWGLPKSAEVAATISAINAFVGAVVGLSTAQYNKYGRYDGTVNVLNADDPDQTTLFDLELEREPEVWQAAKDVTLRINKQ